MYSMTYTVYRITNTLNGMHYVGVHATRDAMDGYMGSGLAIKAAIRKYGKQHFRKEVLFSFDTAAEMYAKERELVVVGPGSYNLMPGGDCGYVFTADSRKKIGDAQRGVPRPYAKGNTWRLGVPQSEDTRKRISEGMKGRPAPNKGKPHSDATKAKMAAAMTGKRNALGLKHSDEWKAAASQRHAGNKNAAGTIWTPEQRARLAAAQQARRERERLACA